MANQVCVIGLGRFGSKLATTLFWREHEVLAIDQSDQRVQEMLGYVTYAVEADATSETALRDLGVPDMDVVVVAFGSQVQSSIITTMLLKSLGVPFVVARATDARHAQILHRVGADKIVFPEEEAAERTASIGVHPVSIDFVNITDTHGVHKLRPPERMRGKRLRDVGLYSESQSRLYVVVIQRGTEYIINPSGDEVIGDGDNLVVVGDHQQVARIFER